MKMTGAKMVVECLKNEGVDVVFGYPGGAIMHVYDEIYKQNSFQHILNRHEQASVHAADGFARSTGRVGVSYPPDKSLTIARGTLKKSLKFYRTKGWSRTHSNSSCCRPRNG